jgi:hypothetical protein
LSGGGIRSASLGLGLIQGLADKNLLQQFNYLSTVSGGGYIGSWLSAWLYHTRDAFRVLAQLRSARADADDEPPSIEHLRDYSSYLTPKLGLLSADTWAAVAIAPQYSVELTDPDPGDRIAGGRGQAAGGGGDAIDRFLAAENSAAERGPIGSVKYLPRRLIKQ